MRAPNIETPTRVRKCPVCGNNTTMRLNQTYCTRSCKQYAYRLRKADTSHASNAAETQTVSRS